MKNILVATDLSARSDRAVLRAIKLAKEFKAKLIITHIIDDQIPRGIIEDTRESAKKEINYCLKGKTKGLEIEIKICIGNAYIEILKATHEENIDLVIVGLHRHIDDNQPMVGNVIERLMKSSHKPLLIVKDRSEHDYSKILSALDFNSHSKESLKTAFNLFSESQFYLLHSYEVPFLGFLGQSNDIEQQIAENSFEDLRATVNDLLKDSKAKKTPQIKQITKKGYILDILKEETQYIKPDLLVLGTHGRSAFARTILPSATETILTNPPCDVFLVVKPITSSRTGGLIMNR